MTQVIGEIGMNTFAEHRQERFEGVITHAIKGAFDE